MALETVIGGRFKLGRKIGSGSFGEIHAGTSSSHSIGICIYTSEEVAIKLVKRLYNVVYRKT